MPNHRPANGSSSESSPFNGQSAAPGANEALPSRRETWEKGAACVYPEVPNIVGALVEKAKENYMVAKFLFEFIGIYPPPPEPDPNAEKNETLARFLLRRLGIPEEEAFESSQPVTRPLVSTGDEQTPLPVESSTLD
jgi:hypothetical protein